VRPSTPFVDRGNPAHRFAPPVGRFGADVERTGPAESSLNRFHAWADWITFDRLSASLLFLALGCTACLMPAQSDTWWLLRTGEEIWKSGAVRLSDSFSFTVNGGYWPNREWLSEVLFYALHQLGGMPLLTAASAVLVVTTWFIVWHLAKSNPTRKLVVVSLAAIPSAMAWSLRPQLFTLVLVACTCYLLERRLYRILPFLFLIWANLHGGVVLGIVFMTAATAQIALERRRIPTDCLVVLGLCVVLTAMTPLGWTLWTEIPPTLARLRHHQVLEWKPPGLRDLPLLPFWLIATAVAVLGVRWLSQQVRGTAINAVERGSVHATAVVGALALLPFALGSARNVPLFLLLAAPALASLLDWRFPSRGSLTERRERPTFNFCLLTAASVASAAMVAHAWSCQIPRLQWHPFPSEAISAVRACPGPLYNNYDDGGYLIWFVPERKVFLDSRLDPYPASLIDAHIHAELSGDYAPLFEQYQIACALTRTGTPLANRLLSDGWHTRYADMTWQVFSR
jgi:hypothetical protein